MEELLVNRNVCSCYQLDLDSIWKFIFKASTQHSTPVSIDMKINVLSDAVITILALIREILNQV